MLVNLRIRATKIGKMIALKSRKVVLILAAFGAIDILIIIVISLGGTQGMYFSINRITHPL